jgi:RimJ/RimL family protein N-acetyltransferase
VAIETNKLPEPTLQLRGERVLLRLYRAEDAPEVFAAINESRERVKVWLPWAADGHKTLADTEEFVQGVARDWEERRQFAFGIWDAETGRYLGGAGYHIRDLDVPYFELGYWIRDGAVGKGYIREAVRLQTTYAFEQMGANRVEIRCDARNDRSRRIPEGLGFQLEGRLRNEARHTDGELRDTLLFALTPEDYAAVSPGWARDNA